MDPTTIATVDAAHAEVIREALDGAGIAVQVIRLRPFLQLDHLRHQRRPLVDIQVPEVEAGRARALLELVQIEAQEAALAEAGDDQDARGESSRAHRHSRPVSPLSSALGFLMALVFPVAGPIYAGASRIIWVSALAHLAAFTMYLLGATHHWYRDDLHANLGLLALAAARFFDVVATLHAIDRHNARLDHTAAQAAG